MAWGYWTTYSTYAIRQTGRENQRALSPPAKRERSLERESRERERQAGGSSGGQGESGSRTPGSFGLGSSGGSAGGSLVHRPYPPQHQSNHVEAEKVAFERRLLLGDPDWSSRTVADRNTLPRKKAHEYDRGSTSEGIYGKNGHSPATTPVDSGSRKSDEMFCPACAQHSATQSNNRDSRVSFGSVASSSRGSRGSSSARGGSAAVPIPMRSRSRSHDDDERSSCSRGGGESGGGAGAFSSSLPTPPPPPFSSQRDILQQHSALMETINQKISILSSFKQQPNKYHTVGPEHHSYRSSRHDQHSRAMHEQQHHHHQQPQHRRSSSNVRSSADDPTGASLEHSSSSLHDRAESRRRRSEGTSKSGGSSRSTARKSSRRSSGSRTPRGNSGSASSRRSRESIGSSERKTNISSGSATAVVPRRRSSSERIDDDYDEDRDGGDEESDDVDNNNIGKTTADRPVASTHSASSSSPKELPLHRESLEKVIARQVVAVAAAAAAAAKSSKPSEQTSRDPKEMGDVEGEDYGTVRRKTRRRSKEDRLSMGEIEERAIATSNLQPSAGSLRSSQSQTPDDDDSAVNNSSEAPLRSSCRRHGSTKSRSNRGDSGGSSKHLASDDVAVTLQQPPPPPAATLISAIAERIPFSLSLKKSGGGSKPPLPPPPQPFHHFKHYDHREHPSSSGHCDFLLIDDKQPNVAAAAPSSRASSGNKPAAECCRPRSASIGNHLSDADVEAVSAGGADYHNNSTFPHRREGRSTSSRRHHTLDGYSRSGYSGGSSGGQAHGGARRGDIDCYDSEEVFLAHGRRLASMTSFHSSATTGVASSRSVSSKSEKSSRSSQSPSVENLRHVFPGVPPAPGMPCQGEDRSIYRRGARRWRKLYKVNGHIFQAKRFNRRAFCAYCHDRIWGLGRQGFKCTQCKLLIHKKCHKLIRVSCDVTQVAALPPHGRQQSTGSGSGSGASAGGGSGRRGNGAHEQELPKLPDEGTKVAKKDLHSDENNVGVISLNDFELIRVIGRGSYAKVLMVELKKTKRIYAMKVIKKELVTDDEDIDWVQTEKHVFETASNHPFLVGLHSCFQTASRLFFVIEFVRGGDLMFHMQRQRRLPEEHARFYSAEICLALNFLHERGIIYRDLKLDNVLLDHEGHIKLTDYGMCKEGIRQGDTTSTFCGTPNYIAPEILRGEDYSFSVDWWALGVLLYEMLAGRSPFDVVGATDNPDQNTEDYLFQVILEKTIRIPRSLSVKAASILKGFLNKNPADRLGCHKETGFMEIMTHPFFKSIEWEALEQKQLPPPYRPRLESERDLANFPPEFTDEPVQLTPDDTSVIEKIDQTEFDGFEYVNPLLMSAEEVV